MTRGAEKASEACGAPHPDHPEVRCQRVLCVEYHASGTYVWTQGARPLPMKTSDPVRFAEILHRARQKK